MAAMAEARSSVQVSHVAGRTHSWERDLTWQEGRGMCGSQVLRALAGVLTSRPNICPDLPFRFTFP